MLKSRERTPKLGFFFKNYGEKKLYKIDISSFPPIWFWGGDLHNQNEVFKNLVVWMGENIEKYGESLREI